MKYSDQSYNIRIELDTENCKLDESEIRKLEEGLSPLREPVSDFPVSALYITIEFKPQSHDYRIKTVLQLPGRGLATGDVDKELYPAYQRCIRKLVHKVSAYKERMSRAEEISKHEKGTHQEIIAERVLDADAVQQAVSEGDYAAFRKQTYPYEEPLRKRVGRWIQRYPEINAQIGERFDIADVVEEVFLNAFERYEERPREVPFGDWIENLIDPSLKLLSKDTDEQLTYINFARTALEADEGSDR